MENCNAFTAQGTHCTRDGHLGGLCGTHFRSLERYGVRGFGLKQIAIKYRELLREEVLKRDTARLDANQLLNVRERNTQLRRIDTEYRRARRDLATRRFDEEALLPLDGAAGGVDRVVDDEEIDLAHAVFIIDNGGAAGGAGDLAKFTKDPQNVHTKSSVDMTKNIVSTILKVPVPEGYRWHPTDCSKTPGEIIMECKLSQKAAWQMMSQYAQDTSIYDIDVGIYGKVLDSAWQFIKNHAEKDSLVAILRSEMQDNIGMCAQGNLTRICNILAGYMDGVGSQESLSERLGRLLPPLRKIENLDERRGRINEILKENAVPTGEWDAWIEAVME